MLVAVSLSAVVIYAVVLCAALGVFNLLRLGHAGPGLGTLAVCVAIEAAQAAIYRTGAFSRMGVQIWLVFVLSPGLAMFAVSRLEPLRTSPLWLALVGPVCYVFGVMAAAFIHSGFAAGQRMP